MAKRVSPELQYAHPSETTWIYGGTATTNVPSDLSNYWNSRTSFSGSTTPGWNLMGRRAKKVALPLDYTYRKEIRGGGSLYESIYLHRESEPYRWLYFYHYATDFVYDPYMPSATHLGEAYDRSISNLVGKASGVKSNLAESFSERKQLSSLIKDNAVRIARAAVALKHGDLSGLNAALNINFKTQYRAWKKVLKTPPEKRLANHWLEFKYGWLPLISDIHGASELLSEHIRDRNETIHVTGNGRAEKTTASRTESPAGVWTYAITKTVTNVKSSISFTVDDEARQLLSQTGISNPALLAWELLPYSFVVDWFIPVGQYLQNLDGFSGLAFRSGYITSFSKMSYEKNQNGSSELGWNGTGEQTYYISAYISKNDVYFTRQALTSFPTPSFPSVKGNPLGGEPVNRVVTALSLLQVAFGRK